MSVLLYVQNRPYIFFQNTLKKYWHEYTSINLEIIQTPPSTATGDIASRISASGVHLLNLGGTPQI